MQDENSLIAIFGENGLVIGSKKRKDIDKKKDILRNVNILLMGQERKFLITKPNDSLWPDKWANSAAGLLRYNEFPLDAAYRTAMRELSIPEEVLLGLLEFHRGLYDFYGIKRHSHFFCVKTDREIYPSTAHIKEARWMQSREIEELIYEDKANPFLKEAFRQLTR